MTILISPDKRDILEEFFCSLATFEKACAFTTLGKYWHKNCHSFEPIFLCCPGRYEALREKKDQLVCECKWTWNEYLRRSVKINCTWCGLNSQMDSLLTSVRIYERRLPDDEVARRCLNFHSNLPEVLRHYREICAFMVDVCLSESTVRSWDQMNSKPHQWSQETPFSFLMALGSTTKPFVNTQYGFCNILNPITSFIVPNGKNVLMGIKVCF